MYDDGFGVLLSLLLGMAWGSFATMAIYRIPLKEPWIGRKPYCPNCGHDLAFIDYLSIFSYFIRQGRCKYCGAKFSLVLVYLFTEIACTLLFLVCYLVFGFSEDFILLAAIGVAIIILSVIEYEHQKINNRVLVVLAMLASAHRILHDDSIYGVIFGFVIAGIVALVARHIYFLAKLDFKRSLDYLQYTTKNRFDGIGMNYVKLVAISGILLPLEQLPSFFMLVFIITIFLQLLCLASNKIMLGSALSYAMLILTIFPQLQNIF